MSPSQSPDWLREGWPHVWLPYAQMKTAAPPLAVTSTDGVRLRLADGRELVDGIASWWTACHGHNHPHIIAAMRRQLETMPHVMFGGLGHEPAFTLARRLAAILPDGLKHVFFSDSGSVAVEVAMKMALQYWRNRGAASRQRFVGFRHGYHGDTMGAMSVSDQSEGLHAALRGAIPEQIIVELPDGAAALAAFDALLARRAGEIAAVIIEPLVQGAGGLKMHDAAVLAAIRASAARHDVLFIADEIFTGFGRTGRMFACQEAGVAPDIMCLSKALTGGAVGLAATVANRRVFEAFLGDSAATALMHGPTYMANPLACAAANASLDLFESQPRLQQVAAIEAQLERELAPCRDIPGVKDVRVKGAIGVVQLGPMRDLDWLRRAFVAEGVWLRPFGDVVYTTPPLVIGEGDLAQLTSAINTVVRAWSHK
jgi:adenosylmethionine---8-amino-7-oxononanoate aminotransferase